MRALREITDDLDSIRMVVVLVHGWRRAGHFSLDGGSSGRDLPVKVGVVVHLDRRLLFGGFDGWWFTGCWFVQLVLTRTDLVWGIVSRTSIPCFEKIDSKEYLHSPFFLLTSHNNPYEAGTVTLSPAGLPMIVRSTAPHEHHLLCNHPPFFMD